MLVPTPSNTIQYVLITSAATRSERLPQNYAGDGDDEDEEMADEEDEDDAELDE